ncbi:MAG: hypothetical protein WCW62_02400 [Bacteroidales bacterium]
MTGIENKLKRCLNLVVEKSGLGDWEDWTKRDYEQLSLLIEEQTKIILSVSTLSRLFKAPDRYKPQKVTLDALAKYIGFDTWHSFCTCDDISNISKPNPPVIASVKGPIWWVYAAGIVVVLVFIFFGSRALLTHRPIHPEDIRFNIRNTDITGVPATIQIDYDLGKYRPDSLGLQLYWNEDEIIRVDPVQKHTTAIYCYPGYHLCKFIADHQVIGEKRVYIKTSGWTALLRHTGLQLVPLYIKNSKIIHDGVLQVTEQMVNTQNLEPNSAIFTSYYFVNDLGPIYGDDYTISGSISNPPTSLGTQPCGYCTVFIVGESGKHFFTIGDLGCSAFFKLGFSGADNMKTYPDLTDFEYISDRWNTFKSVVSGNTVTIYVGKSKVYSSHQVNNIGKIKGIHFAFSGLGAIDGVKLENSKNFVAMDEVFE